MDVNHSLNFSNGPLGTIKAIRRLGPAGNNRPALDSDAEAILRLLLEANLDLHGLMPWSSNYTFLVGLEDMASVVDTLVTACAHRKSRTLQGPVDRSAESRRSFGTPGGSC